jgi:hypothetical protein
MKKIMKIYPHVITMDIDLVRKHFTTHSLHMNSRGKCEIAQKIATQITDVATRKKEKKPVITPWDPETDVRHRTGEDTNQQRIEESVDITTLSSVMSSPQKQPDDNKQIRTVEGVGITPCYKVEGPPRKPFLAMTEPPNGSAF